jgi:uridine kinase
VIVNQDRYHRDLAHLDGHQRSHHNLDHPNTIEKDLLEKHIEVLKAGEAAALQLYVFACHVRAVTRKRVDSQPVILVE